MAAADLQYAIYSIASIYRLAQNTTFTTTNHKNSINLFVYIYISTYDSYNIADRF